MPTLHTLLQQLPQSLQTAVSEHLGSTAGMTEIQALTRYRDVAGSLKANKLAKIPSSYTPRPERMTPQQIDRWTKQQGILAPRGKISLMLRDAAYESALMLDNFVNQLQPMINQLHEAARVQAHRQAEEAARQEAQRQAEEAARQLAQGQAKEAARQHAQHLAEEAARQVAARQLAEQQANAAAQALAEQKAQEATLQEARLALELAPVITAQPPETAFTPEPTSNEIIPAPNPAREIVFMPGPAAMAEIDRATLALKQSIDAAVIQYASAISPYLNSAAPGTHAIQ